MHCTERKLGNYENNHFSRKHWEVGECWVQKGQQILSRLNSTKSIPKYIITNFSMVKKKKREQSEVIKTQGEKKRCLSVFLFA